MESGFCANCQSLQRRLRDLQAENEHLRRQFGAVPRAGKRQAGPYAKGEPKPNPKRPGRKAGKDYGPKAHRKPPQRSLAKTANNKWHQPPGGRFGRSEIGRDGAVEENDINPPGKGDAWEGD
jgi:hypothetical protein